MVMVAMLSTPAFAAKGGVIPLSYGDCASNVATKGDFLESGIGIQEFTGIFAPPLNQGQERSRVVCNGLSPG